MTKCIEVSKGACFFFFFLGQVVNSHVAKPKRVFLQDLRKNNLSKGNEIQVCFKYGLLVNPVLFLLLLKHLFCCVSNVLLGIRGGNEDSWEVLHTHPVCGDV